MYTATSPSLRWILPISNVKPLPDYTDYPAAEPPWWRLVAKLLSGAELEVEPPPSHIATK